MRCWHWRYCKTDSVIILGFAVNFSCRVAFLKTLDHLVAPSSDPFALPRYHGSKHDTLNFKTLELISLIRNPPLPHFRWRPIFHSLLPITCRRHIHKTCLVGCSSGVIFSVWFTLRHCWNRFWFGSEWAALPKIGSAVPLVRHSGTITSVAFTILQDRFVQLMGPSTLECPQFRYQFSLSPFLCVDNMITIKIIWILALSSLN